MKKNLFQFTGFSKKQKKVLTWWIKGKSPHSNADAIITDGSVRSGKTLIMSLSYVVWSMESFKNKNFGMAGKTIGSFKRNVWILLKMMLLGRGYKIRKVPDTDSNNAYAISKGDVTNYYYIFGGKDEKSQDLVQGFTAAGFLFDEVVLMPESFVNQAIARCSEEGAKIWFNCNPDGPFHWFKREWIDKKEEKNALRIHFELDDNPSLSEKVKQRYKQMFSGIFYDRFIKGLWVIAEGVIYSMFEQRMIIDKLPPNVKIIHKWIGIDYGQSNATVFLLIGLGSDNCLYVLEEYYHEGRSSHVQKSPLKYAKDFAKFYKLCQQKWGQVMDGIFIDPSAKGFMLQIYEEGVKGIRSADNEVLKGIELTSSIIDNNKFRVMSSCKNVIKEMGAYRWDPKAQERGEDVPVKQFDHAMDALRYVVNGTRKIWQRIIVSEIKRTA